MVYSSTREVVDALRRGTAEERAEIVGALGAHEVSEGITAADLLKYDWPAWARDEQLAPDCLWDFLFLRAGRGGGKTRSGAEFIIHGANHPELCAGRMALIAPTYADIRIIMVEGTSGILACSPPWNMPVWSPGHGHGGRLLWANGVEALCFTAQKPGQIRGPEFGRAWGDEVGEWGVNGVEVHEILDASMRLAALSQTMYTSTPKATPFVEMLADESAKEVREVEEGRRDPRDRSFVQRVWSTSRNAANLPDRTVKRLYRKYGGTTRGREQLDAELITGDPLAMWSLDDIVPNWVAPEDVPDLVKVVVAIDNATTSNPPGELDMTTAAGRNRNVGSNDTGIGAVGLGTDDIIYVLDDWTCNEKPAKWAEIALEAYASPWPNRRANEIVAEQNGGYDLILRNLNAFMLAEGINPDLVPIRMVNARDGKWARADPIHTMYQKGRVKHVHRSLTAPGAIGRLDDLEYQMCRFCRKETGVKRDRVDWLVWGVTRLISGPKVGGRAKRAKRRLATYVR